MTLRITGHATYGAFVDAAASHVAAAAVGLALGPMSGTTAAVDAVAAYRRVLRAMYVHTRALFVSPDRLRVADASPSAVTLRLCSSSEV